MIYLLFLFYTVGVKPRAEPGVIESCTHQLFASSLIQVQSDKGLQYYNCNHISWCAPKRLKERAQIQIMQHLIHLTQEYVYYFITFSCERCNSALTFSISAIEQQTKNLQHHQNVEHNITFQMIIKQLKFLCHRATDKEFFTSSNAQHIPFQRTIEDQTKTSLNSNFCNLAASIPILTKSKLNALRSLFHICKRSRIISKDKLLKLYVEHRGKLVSN